MQPAPRLGPLPAAGAGSLRPLVGGRLRRGSGARCHGYLRRSCHRQQHTAFQPPVGDLGQTADVQGLVLFDYSADVEREAAEEGFSDHQVPLLVHRQVLEHLGC